MANKKEFEEILKEYKEYFADDMENIEKEIEKNNILFDMIEQNIEKIQHAESRGSYSYLIKHFENIISLQSQKQGILKDRVALKKIIMDYVQKNKPSENNSFDDITKELQNLIEETKKKAKEEAKTEVVQIPLISDKDLDAEIDASLDEDNE